MIRIGIVGIGFMGRIHYLAAQRLKGAKVTAVCSRDKAKLAGDWSATRGNFGPEPGRVDLTDVKKYEYYDAMLAAAKAAGKLLMVAHVLPFFPEFRFAADAVRSGRYGKLIGAHFTRVIA